VRNIVTKAVAVLGVAVVAACSDAVGPPTSSLQPDANALTREPKVTVCHASGREGTTKYVAIEVSAHGANAHFTNNGTPKAGHELDFIATAERPCNPEPNTERKALLKVCKLSSANNPATADLHAKFHFKTSNGREFSLQFNECTKPTEVDPGEITITEAHDPNAPNAFSYYATSVVVTNGVLLASSGFSGPPRPTTVQDAIARVRTTSGELTTVTFYNRN
jgi:hypothetical protein